MHPPSADARTPANRNIQPICKRSSTWPYVSRACASWPRKSLVYTVLYTSPPPQLDDGEPVELDATGAAEARAQKAIRLATPPSRPAQHLLLHAMNAREQATAAGEELDLATFAQLLANAGHNVWLRTGLPPNRDPAKYVHHTFVVCSLRQPSGARRARTPGGRRACHLA